MNKLKQIVKICVASTLSALITLPSLADATVYTRLLTTIVVDPEQNQGDSGPTKSLVLLPQNKDGTRIENKDSPNTYVYANNPLSRTYTSRILKDETGGTFVTIPYFIYVESTNTNSGRSIKQCALYIDPDLVFALSYGVYQLTGINGPRIDSSSGTPALVNYKVLYNTASVCKAETVSTTVPPPAIPIPNFNINATGKITVKVTFAE